jgi:hypothetical protein
VNFNAWRFPGRLRMAIVLFAIVAGFYWKITLTSQFDWVWGPDLATQVMPWFAVQARSWHAGTFPLWDPYLWAGQPLLGQAQPGGAYPLNWLLFNLPLDHGQISTLALQWYFVAIRFLAVAFCYLLCRDLGRSRMASAIAGLVFGLGGLVGSTGWPQMVNGAIWAPLVFLFLLRAVRGNNRWGNAALSGMFLGVAWLSGHHQLPFFTMLAAGGAWLYFIFRSGRLDRRVAVAAMAAFLFTGLTGALQILPASEYGHLAKRWAGTPEPLAWNQPVPYYVHEQYSFKPEDLLGLVFPIIKVHFDPFVGIVALALAWIGIAAFWRDHRVRLIGALSLGGILYAMGQHSVFQGFLYAVIPTLDKARSPSAAILIFEFGVAVLAAFGMDQLSSGEPSPWPRRVMWTVVSFGVFTLAVFQAVYFANKMTFPGDDRVAITAFFALLLGALLFAWMRGAVTARLAGVLMAGLVLLELGNNYVPVFTPRTEPGRERWSEQMKANGDVADFLRRQPGFQRANVPNDAFNANWGAVHEVEMWGGSLASVTANLLSFEFHRLEARMLYGVAYTIGTQPNPGAGEEVFSGESGMKVFRNGAAFPRAWAVHKLLEVRDMGEGNSVMMGHLPEMHDQAVLLGKAPALEPCWTPGGAQEKVELLEHGADRLLIRANLSCPGMVILSDTYFPGWRARVDRKAAQIYEVNGAMRGVMVPAGLHSVTMRYRPASVIVGGALTLVGILGALGLVAAGGIRSRPGGRDAVRLAISQWLDASR